MMHSSEIPEATSAHQARVWAAFTGGRPDRVPICETAFASRDRGERAPPALAIHSWAGRWANAAGSSS